MTAIIIPFPVKLVPKEEKNELNFLEYDSVELKQKIHRYWNRVFQQEY